MKKFVTVLFLAVGFLILESNSYCHEFTSQQKEIIRNGIDKLLSDYQTYAGLTEDGEKISSSYISKFENLFTKNIYIINDIDPEKKLPKVISIKTYIETLQKWYIEGVSTQLSYTQIIEPVIQVKKNDEYYMSVKAKKSLAGLYMNKKVHNTLNIVYFKIVFTKSLDKFKIQAIQDTEILPPDAQKITTQKGLYLGLRLQTGPTNILYKDIYNSENLSTTGELGFNTGIEVSYFFNNNIGLGLGFEVSTYKTILNLDNYQNSFITTDTDGDSYERRVTSPAVEEIQELMYFDVPVCIKTRFMVSNKFGFYLNLGTKLSIPVLKNYSGQGEFTYKGFYSSYNIELYDLPLYGFPSDVQVEKSDDLDLSSISFTGFSSLGISISVSNSINLNLGANFVMGLSDISNYNISDFQLSREAGDYYSLMQSSSKSTTKAYGFEIGVAFKVQ